jgi:hypothetical protein
VVLTVSFVLSPVIGLLATVASEKLASQKLDASIGASGPHDFAVRFSAVRQKRINVHRIPPHVRDDREPPLYRVGWPMEDVIWVRTTAEYFRQGYWTQCWCDRPNG